VTEPRRRLHLSPPLIEGLIIAALLLLPLLFWWQLWLPEPADRATIPEGDLSSQYYPLQLFAARELAAGRIPAWDPYLNAGQPGLADIQTGFYYPLNLLPNLVWALLGWPFTMGVLTGQIILHFSLASLFTYLFVRHLARRAGARRAAARFAGAVAALSFTYAGYLTSFPVQQITILETAVWLPLVLLFLDRAFYSRQPWSQAILAALALACALLAGHPQTAMYVVYAALAYSFGLLFMSSPATPASRSRLGSLLILLLALALGAALATVQLAPTWQFIARSSRAGLGYEDVSWGFPLAEMTHLLYPGYFGGSPQYVGILPLILAAAAWFVRRARREVAFWSGVAVLALLLSFGGHTFLYNLAHLALPGFGLVRDQERIIYLFSFALSVLAGYGALTLVQPLPAQAGRGFRRFWRGLAWVGVFMLALTALFYYGYLQGEQQGVEINLFACCAITCCCCSSWLARCCCSVCGWLAGCGGDGWWRWPWPSSGSTCSPSTGATTRSRPGAASRSPKPTWSVSCRSSQRRGASPAPACCRAGRALRSSTNWRTSRPTLPCAWHPSSALRTRWAAGGAGNC